MKTIESGYALKSIWGKIKCDLKGIKRIYLVISIIYIVLSLLFIPKYTVFEDSVERKSFDSYTELVLTNDIKLNYILDKYNLTLNEFKILAAITLSESGSSSYYDAYAVINTIYNRTHSKNWVSTVNKHFGKDKGYSLYYQAISPGQFTVYKSGSYKRHLGETNSKGYQAILDFLYSEEKLHEYLSFRANFVNVKTYETFAKNGNKYFNKITEKNRI